MEKVSTNNSQFTGGFWGMLGTIILCDLICIFTLTIGTPWAIVKFIRWKTEHTYYNGQPLKFNGTGGKLFGKLLGWLLLTIITCCIFGLFVPVKFMRWQVENTSYPLPQQDKPVLKPSNVQPAPVSAPKVSAPIVQVSVGNSTTTTNPSTASQTVASTSTVAKPATTVQNKPSAPSQTSAEQKTFSPLTHAPVPATPEQKIVPNKKAGLGVAIFAVILGFLASFIISFAVNLQSAPEVYASLNLPEVILNLNTSYYYYIAAAISFFQLILSIVGISKYNKEKERSGAKPVATLVFSIIALINGIVGTVVYLSFNVVINYILDFINAM